jgi:hypothetical protein
MLNGLCSGICGGASFREERLTLAELRKMDVSKINDDDDDCHYYNLQIHVVPINEQFPVTLFVYWACEYHCWLEIHRTRFVMKPERVRNVF